jgi:asparagine synthase (glutamine-hydrolysing)
MCGIAGYYNRSASQEQINELTARLRHRGPDDQRHYTNNHVGLIHTRLSIIDLTEGGAQPYRFENLVIVFNGELYNYKEVRETLVKHGYTFQSNSDTEVLLKAFHKWGEQCVHQFIGMFAFAVYDETADAIWLFRDRLGVKPLYYSYENQSLTFASELKALSVFNHDRTIDLHSVYYFFRFGFIPEHRSIFKSIAKLEAGHYLRVNRTGIKKEKYWNPAFDIDHSKTERQWIDELEETMISAFRYRMVSDVPVGVFLSGGIDSSLLAAILKKHFGDIHSFTIGFKEQQFDESKYTRKVAEHLGIHHTEKMLTLVEAKKILNEFYSIYDEPFADTSGIPTACVTALAKEHGMKVVLSADGGDEIFGGYSHYPRALKLYKKVFAFSNAVRSAWTKGSRALLPRKLRDKIVAFNTTHKMYAIEELLQSENSMQLFEAMLANQSIDEVHKLIGNHGTPPYLHSTHTSQEPVQQMMIWDLKHYLTDDLLVKVDRATMYHGIECREPMLDHRLVELAMTIPVELKMKDGKGKYIERQLLSRYVPTEFFERKKQGFSIPVFTWFQQDLDTMFNTHLTQENLRQMNVLDPDEVLREFKKYKSYKKRSKDYNIEKMWRILSFALWWEKYKQHEG